MKKIFLLILTLLSIQVGNSFAQIIIGGGPSKACGGTSYSYGATPPSQIVKKPDWKETTSEKYTWTIVRGTCVSSDCKTNVINVKWDNSCGTGSIKAKFVRKYNDTNDNPKIQTIESRIEDVIVILPESSVTTISASSTSIECFNNDVVLFTANGCAETYTWQYPNGWSTLHRDKNYTRLIPDNATGGKVVVTAQSSTCPNSSPKKVEINIIRTCLDNKTFLLPQNLPSGHMSVNDNIIVNNNGVGFISVVNSKKVWLKAGKKINIKNNFKVESGGFFQAKIAPCNGCFAFKNSAENTSENPNGLTKKLESKAPDIKICPNPNNGTFNITFPNNYWGENKTRANYYIYNTLGKRIEFGTIEDNTFTKGIDISKYPSGIYIVELKTGTEKYISRIIKQ